MIKKYGLSAIFFIVIFQVILIYSSFISGYYKDWKNLTLSIVAIICLYIPFLLKSYAGKKGLLLPPGFIVIILLFIFAAMYLGEINEFYYKFFWWDLLLHAIAGAFVAILPFYFVTGVIKRDEKSTKKRFHKIIAIFAFSVSITIGTLWEMIEFLCDYFFHTNMVKGGLNDTATDLIIKITFALLSTIVCYVKGIGLRIME